MEVFIPLEFVNLGMAEIIDNAVVHDDHYLVALAGPQEDPREWALDLIVSRRTQLVPVRD